MDKSTEEEHSPSAAAPALQQQKNPCSRDNTALRLNFRKAPLGTVLNYFNTAGLLIYAQADVQTHRRIDLCQGKPVSCPEALQLLKQVLGEIGCALIQKGPLFSVIRSQDLKKHCILLPAIQAH